MHQCDIFQVYYTLKEGKYCNSSIVQQCNICQVQGKYCKSATSCVRNSSATLVLLSSDPRRPSLCLSLCHPHSILRLYLIRDQLCRVANVSRCECINTHTVTGCNRIHLQRLLSPQYDPLSRAVHSNKWREIDKFNGKLKQDCRRWM